MALARKSPVFEKATRPTPEYEKALIADLSPAEERAIVARFGGGGGPRPALRIAPQEPEVHPTTPTSKPEDYPTERWVADVGAWIARSDWVKKVRAAEHAAGFPPFHQFPAATMTTVIAQCNELFRNPEWLTMWVEWCKTFTKSWGLSRMALTIVRITYHSCIANQVLMAYTQRQATQVASVAPVGAPETDLDFGDDPADDLNDEDDLPSVKPDAE